MTCDQWSLMSLLDKLKLRRWWPISSNKTFYSKVSILFFFLLEIMTLHIHRLQYCTNITYMYWETQKFVWLILSWYLLYCSGLELNPQKYLRGMPILKFPLITLLWITPWNKNVALSRVAHGFFYHYPLPELFAHQYSLKSKTTGSPNKNWKGGHCLAL